MSLPAYERLGVFYLGREIDPDKGERGAELLYDSRDLTTHAVCIGMTGSGKTGLCVSLLEEAAIDGIPAIAIDPKGDIGNLLLTFPKLGAEDFAPWVDAGEAARKGQSVDEYAAATAETWRKGLANWGEDGDRIARLRESADITIYTPGSSAGRPLSVLRSFGAPDRSLLDDANALKERIGSSVGGLLALLGIDVDPLRSREHILLSAILDAAWRKGESPDLAAIIQGVQKPPFDRIGVFDVESFYPAKERTEFALRINSLLAAPGFDAWLQGDALDVQQLLYGETGKPRIAIISIAHLNDAERMFVVTLIANEVVAWMRRQPGTSSLRALLYLDEVFGFFPPTAMPPSKLPLLTLMKQARAFGVGVVLATQNPVDLDYKGLGNAGTWFIGRLQTERDKARVIEGLLGSEAAGGLDRQGYEALMSNLAPRSFLMRNVHDDAPVVFRTRWALSYLRGPLTLAEIRRLQADGPATDATPARQPGSSNAEVRAKEPPHEQQPASAAAGGARPVVQYDVTERFLERPGSTQPTRYSARIGASTRLHFVDAKADVDTWQTAYYLTPVASTGPDWNTAEVLTDPEQKLAETAPDGASFADPPAVVLSSREYKRWAGELEDHLYRNVSLDLWTCPALKLTAAPGTTEGEFRARVALALREKRDAAVDALRKKYGVRFAKLAEQERRARQKVDKERAQASDQTLASALSVGGSLLGALFGGGRRSSLRQARTAARTVSRASKERADVAHAEADVAALRQQSDALNAELDAEIARLESELQPDAVPVETRSVKARRSDIEVTDLALVWCP